MLLQHGQTLARKSADGNIVSVLNFFRIFLDVIAVVFNLLFYEAEVELRALQRLQFRNRLHGLLARTDWNIEGLAINQGGELTF